MRDPRPNPVLALMALFIIGWILAALESHAATVPPNTVTATGAATFTLRENAELVQPSAPTTVFTLNKSIGAYNLKVYRNGLLLARGIDYTFASDGTVALTAAQTPADAGDILQFIYSTTY